MIKRVLTVPVGWEDPIFTTKEVERWLEHVGVMLFIALPNPSEKYAAHLLVRLVGQEVEILTLYTHPEARQKGHAKALMESMVEEMKAREVSVIHCEVREKNRPARRLYAAQGFMQTGTRPNYYNNPKDDACLYQLAL